MSDTADGRVAEARRLYAYHMAAVGRSPDPRLEEAFAAVPREAFVPPGPWRIVIGGVPMDTPNDDPVHLYQNVLITLDRAKQINNGEPSLHALWMDAVAPRPGEELIHIGAGAGYYTAILSLLVGETGRVTGYEIDAKLAEAAARNCASYPNVTILPTDAVTAPLPACEIVYVNAGVVAPPLSWLEALKPGGRLIFPWHPAEHIGIALLARRGPEGLSVETVSGAWFIPCVGASDPSATVHAPDVSSAWSVRSLWPTARRSPDETAVAVYRDLWFSSREIPASTVKES